MSVIIKEKDNSIPWESITNLLKNAHQANQKIGVQMKTVHITTEQLVHRVELGKTYIALTTDNQLVGTASIIPQTGKKWYDKNKNISFCLYVGVHPDYQGKGIASKLYRYIEEASKTSFNSYLIKSGTAEKNIPQRKTFLKNGYIPVELVSNKNTNYYSIIYIKFNNKVPLPIWIYKLRYIFSYIYFKMRYKPGKNKRFLLVYYITKIISKLKL